MITVNHRIGGPLISGAIGGRNAKIFLDKRSSVNIITTDTLRKVVVPGLNVLEPIHLELQGVTGNKLTTKGHIKFDVSLDHIHIFEVDTMVVDQSLFPGHILIGLPAMYQEYISIISSEIGVKFSYKFISFIGQEDACRGSYINFGEMNDIDDPSKGAAERSKILSVQEQITTISINQQLEGIHAQNNSPEISHGIKEVKNEK